MPTTTPGLVGNAHLGEVAEHAEAQLLRAQVSGVGVGTAGHHALLHAAQDLRRAAHLEVLHVGVGVHPPVLQRQPGGEVW